MALTPAQLEAKIIALEICTMYLFIKLCNCSSITIEQFNNMEREIKDAVTVPTSLGPQKIDGAYREYIEEYLRKLRAQIFGI